MRGIRCVKALFIAPLLAALGGCTKTTPDSRVPANLHNVEANIWRSAQPQSLDEWRGVKALGVKAVLKLNYDDEGSDADAESLGLVVYRFGMEPAGDKDVFDNILNAFKKPDRQSLLDAISVIETHQDGILIHCTHGQDRTGLLVGLWRLIHDDWDKPRAYNEMLWNGFHPELRGLREFWEGFNVPPAWR